MDLHPFDFLVRGDGDFRLAEAALLFALDHSPGLKPFHYLSRLDALARRVEREHPRTTEERIEALRDVLVAEQGLRGNQDDYYDPRNSLLNVVLDRKVGSPISLSVIWLDVACTLEWPLFGVGLPGHFVVGYDAFENTILLDPFHGGRELSIENCQTIVDGLTNGQVQLDADAFKPVPSRFILTRMLHNLKSALLGRQAWSRAVSVLSRLIALHPDSIDLVRERDKVAGMIASRN